MAYDHKGKVKHFNAQKKFGFVKLDSGEDAFFHISACSRNVAPQQGDRVRCDIDTQDQRGPRVTAMVFE